jgi:hypothetical protein
MTAVVDKCLRVVAQRKKRPSHGFEYELKTLAGARLVDPRPAHVFREQNSATLVHQDE